MESEQKSIKRSRFWFGDEDPGVSGFFQTAAGRSALVLPIVVTFSGSATIFVTYLTAAFWLLGGHWKQRLATVRSSAILWTALPLILWTGIGIFRFEDSLAWSIRYWFGHYPYIMILVLATLLTRKKDQYAMLSSMNLAILLCCVWAVGFYLYHSDLGEMEFLRLRKQSIYLYRNTICFGVALALWGGLWACFPYTSRKIPWIRRRLPRPILDGMEKASRTSLFALMKTVVPFTTSDLRRRPWALFFSFLRWSIIVSIMVYLFMLNPSRTAQAIILPGYAAILLCWNWKKGFVAILCLLLPLAIGLGLNSENFKTKADRTVHDIREALSILDGDLTPEAFSKKNRDRLGIWASLYQDVRERPVIGYGMEKAVEIVKARSKYNDPHNEFVFMQIQNGAIGLACFTLWLFSIFIVSFYRNNPWRAFGVFLFILLLVDCTVNTAFSYHRETYLLCLSVALLAVQKRGRRLRRPAQGDQSRESSLSTEQTRALKVSIF